MPYKPQTLIHRKPPPGVPKTMYVLYRRFAAPEGWFEDGRTFDFKGARAGAERIAQSGAEWVMFKRSFVMGGGLPVRKLKIEKARKSR